jgi:lysyl-tRNA synthetase class 1
MFTLAQYQAATSWPFEEAKRVIAHVNAKAKAGKADKGFTLFETGYGPSGLPHIGTFGEVFRTTMVRHAYEYLEPGRKTRLFAFSDDMDGLRKVPENIPNKEQLIPHLHKPLTRVPDPFGQYQSFAHHNNAMLRKFLDSFSFAYEFISSTEHYTSGAFDKALLQVLKHHQEICDTILPTLGTERAASYSPFLPICPESGHVLQVPVIATNVAKGTITYRRADGKEVETAVTGGLCKLQWKPDWATRWYDLDVDYEMCGKDLIDSVTLGTKICEILGGTPPVNLVYEHFVDEHGAKISKSKGNGLTIEEWLRNAPAESLSLYMFRTPTRAKKLYRSLIPTVVEEYTTLLEQYPTQSPTEQLDNPAFHLHHGKVPANPLPIPYSMLLNLISVTAATEASVVWKYLSRHRPELTPQTAPALSAIITGALNYYAETIKPTQSYLHPKTEQEINTLHAVSAFLETLSGTEDAELIQTEFYEIGKKMYGKENLRAYFKFIYQCLLGFENGPRLGTFTLIYGPTEMHALVTQALARKSVA